MLKYFAIKLFFSLHSPAFYFLFNRIDCNKFFEKKIIIILEKEITTLWEKRLEPPRLYPDGLPLPR